MLPDGIVEAVLSDWRTAPLEEPFRMMLGVLEKATRTPSQLTSEEICSLRQAGISEQAIEDALVIGALFNMIDRLADAFSVAIPSAEGFSRTGDYLLERGYV